MHAKNVDEIDRRCQFHQRHMREKFIQKSFLAAFSSHVLALAPKFVQKTRTYKVDEIDGR